MSYCLTGRSCSIDKFDNFMDGGTHSERMDYVSTYAELDRQLPANNHYLLKSFEIGSKSCLYST